MIKCAQDMKKQDAKTVVCNNSVTFCFFVSYLASPFKFKLFLSKWLNKQHIQA